MRCSPPSAIDAKYKGQYPMRNLFPLLALGAAALAISACRAPSGAASASISHQAPADRRPFGRRRRAPPARSARAAAPCSRHSRADGTAQTHVDSACITSESASAARMHRPTDVLVAELRAVIRRFCARNANLAGCCMPVIGAGCVDLLSSSPVNLRIP